MINTQESGGVLREFAFFQHTEQLMGKQPLEASPYMLNMQVSGTRVDQYVLQICKCTIVQHVPQNVIKEVLK